MTRKECLDKAAECVLRDRQKQYGKPEDCFETIAMMWSAYLGKPIQGWDVATMMALLKIARIKTNPAHADNWCDLAGYAACGAECRQKFEAEMKKTVEDAFETFPHLKPKAESGCFQNGNDHSPEASAEPEFQRGDKVEVQMVPDSSTWASAVITAVYRDKDSCEWRYCVGFDDGWTHVVVPSARVRPVSSPKAEGCEALVEKDAPRTPQELCKRIIDANPATFKARTPTGEELAEMAEEEPHG